MRNIEAEAKDKLEDLHAAVQLRMDVEFVGQDEIAVVFFRAEKGVRCVGNGVANDHALLRAILGLAAALHPAVEILAVEYFLKTLLARKRRDRQRKGTKNDWESFHGPDYQEHKNPGKAENKSIRNSPSEP